MDPSINELLAKLALAEQETKDGKKAKEMMEEELRKTKSELDTLKNQSSQATLDSLTTENTSLKALIADANVSVEDLRKQVDLYKTESEKLKKDKEEMEKEKAAYTQSEALRKEAKAIRKVRTQALVEAKVPAEKAKELAKTFSALNDEHFKAVADLAIQTYGGGQSLTLQYKGDAPSTKTWPVPPVEGYKEPTSIPTKANIDPDENPIDTAKPVDTTSAAVTTDTGDDPVDAEILTFVTAKLKENRK